jgi:branched-chain amino acid transport system ATP-binding protein
VFPNLTVAENVRMMTHARRDLTLPQVEEQVYARFPILGQRRRQLAATLSGGEQQMLALSRAIAADPALLLVDELSMGLAPMVVAQLYDVLRQFAEDGVAILLVEQFAHTALAIADYAAIMVQGRIQTMGQPADLGDDVAAAYLGMSA